MAKSLRNKTINTSLEEGQHYLDRCLPADSLSELKLEDIINKTVIGDCLEAMKLMEDESVDLIIADPPYNLNKTFSSLKFKRMNSDEYAMYTRQWLEEARRLLKPDGSIYVCCDWESSLVIGGIMDELFNVRNRITWQREKGRGAKSNWKNSMEDIWFATKSDAYTFNLEDVKVRRKVIAPYRQNGKPKDWEETEDGNFRDTCPSNFWDDITIPFWSMAENTEHPTQKPEKLIAKLILASSNEQDLVFDPFLGSGTTSVVAKKLGRNYIGIEQEKQFCIWAEQRLQMADSNKKIQGYEEGVFWERNLRK